jgi:hypothetical protein
MIKCLELQKTFLEQDAPSVELTCAVHHKLLTTRDGPAGCSQDIKR